MAINLRKEGKSYGDISIDLKVARSTLSYWLRDIVITEEQRADIFKRSAVKVGRGRMNASIANRAKRMIDESRVYSDAKREFGVFIDNPFFVLGVAFYNSHGSQKGSFQFTTRDIGIIRVMTKWLIIYLKIEDSVVKVVRYNRYYRINVNRIDVLRRVVAWQKLLLAYYSDTK